jgi:hypothetical protein
VAAVIFLPARILRAALGAGGVGALGPGNHSGAGESQRKAGNVPCCPVPSRNALLRGGEAGVILVKTLWAGH